MLRSNSVVWIPTWTECADSVFMADNFFRYIHASVQAQGSIFWWRWKNACCKCLLTLTCRKWILQWNKRKRIVPTTNIAETWSQSAKPSLRCNEYSLKRIADACATALEMYYWKDLRKRPFHKLVRGPFCRVRIGLYSNDILGLFHPRKVARATLS